MKSILSLIVSVGIFIGISGCTDKETNANETAIKLIILDDQDEETKKNILSTSKKDVLNSEHIFWDRIKYFLILKKT